MTMTLTREMATGRSRDEVFSPHLSAPPMLLIQVPVVRPSRSARLPSAAPTERLRAWRPGHAHLTPRRRLRREIRQAGTALLMISPFLLSIAMWKTWPLPGSIEESASPPRPPAVSISLEPPGGGRARSERWSPVLLPGYVLPDDGGEEPSHAGG